jgi:hypothetical protein
MLDNIYRNVGCPQSGSGIVHGLPNGSSAQTGHAHFSHGRQHHAMFQPVRFPGFLSEI